MIFSHSPENEKFFLFSIFLQNLIEGDENYEDIVKPIISDAHKLVLHKKNYYDIDRENYSIILYLSKNYKDVFEKIDPDNINSDQYKQILGFIDNYNSISVF
jgi:hypothetical protein